MKTVFFFVYYHGSIGATTGRARQLLAASAWNVANAASGRASAQQTNSRPSGEDHFKRRVKDITPRHDRT
jgi:hypothetical protein